MKYQYITIPNIEYEEKLRTFLYSGYYYTFCKKYSKRFENRHEKVEENPDKMIGKLISSSYDILLKIKLFIHDLYLSEWRYKGAYNNYTHMHEKGYDYILFFESHSKIQERIYDSRYRELIIDFLKSEKIIEVDKSYWTLEAQKKGSKSKGYRVHPRLYSQDIPLLEKRLTIAEDLYNKYNGIDTLQRGTTYPKYIKRLRDQFDGWRLDVDAIPNNLKEEYEENIQTYLNADYFTFSGKGNRMYTPETFVKSELKKYLYYKERENTTYKLIEISNCHAYTLSTMLPADLTNKEKESLNSISRSLTLYMQNSDEEDKQYIIDQLSEMIQHDRHGVLDLSDNYNNIIDHVEIIEHDPDFENLLNSDKQEYIVFMFLAMSSTIYDALADRFGYTRSELKGWYRTVFNFDNELFDYNKFEFLAMMSNCFPKVMKKINTIRSNSTKNYSNMNQKIESEIMLKNVCQYLVDNDIEFIGLHDGVIVPEHHEIETQIEVQLTAKRIHGLDIPTRIEAL
ncbi:hypothetical protein [Fodinibius salsisoli]|uniref:DNA-directed DNA polymerase n=1 Tax=Fodinibius salsisoli TaxID=2820877 RepID=A0ABT3PIP6_9BACT|nr:hypothetical protein [Fodinibius salsisoli]MCW9705813.1 hypothetical protein [Fodinibius salsisoli]